ncbi:hypothetical protein IMZ48_17430 [Candidatus Bathyarchaeota archaeon]|nr:hypothetical protein [Candidatus Bathyarchaeota archaeon]
MPLRLARLAPSPNPNGLRTASDALSAIASEDETAFEDSRTHRRLQSPEVSRSNDRTPDRDGG